MSQFEFHSDLSPDVIAALKAIVGPDALFLDQETRSIYGHDETEDLNFPPAVVLKPKTVDEVSAIMKIASEYVIPVTPIGARTGLSGGRIIPTWRDWLEYGKIQRHHRY